MSKENNCYTVLKFNLPISELNTNKTGPSAIVELDFCSFFQLKQLQSLLLQQISTLLKNVAADIIPTYQIL